MSIDADRFTECYAAAMMAQIVSLNARADACNEYAYNQGLQLEARILRKQVEALHDQLVAMGYQPC